MKQCPICRMYYSLHAFELHAAHHPRCDGGAGMKGWVPLWLLFWGLMLGVPFALGFALARLLEGK
jgi:hypothetical protein